MEKSALITEERRGNSFSRQNCERQVGGERAGTVDVNNIIFRFVLPVINTIIVCKHYTLLHDTLHTPQSELSKQTKYFFLSNIFSSLIFCICKINVFPTGSAACLNWTASVSQAKNGFRICFLNNSKSGILSHNNKSNYAVAVY